jgi:Uma2 family endonuclease
MDDVLAKVDVPRRRFTVDEYYRMGEVGILTEKDRVELIDGDIIQMSPIGSRHGHCIAALNERLMPAVVGRALLRPQLPLFISSRTEPQPDVLLVKPGAHYWGKQPRPEDVLLLVEVAETSYSYDRNVKLPLYARENIPEVWIIDLVRGAVEVYREPGPRGYQSLTRLERGATLTPAAFPDVVIAVMEILPPA